MNVRPLTRLLLAALCLSLCMSSCEKDACEGVSCENGGVETETTNGCACDCSATLYIGTNCENFNLAEIQALLDAGVTPKELVDAGVPVDSLYGKAYEDGLIFYLNATDGTGMVAAIQDQSTSAEWGCFDLDIPDLNNANSPVDSEEDEGARVGDGETNTNAILSGCIADDIAAKLCRDIGPNWFLPSRLELDLMYTNLHVNGYGNFALTIYWSSTEFSSGLSWYQDFNVSYHGGSLKHRNHHVRAARAF